jgi:hypothetical protein
MCRKDRRCLQTVVYSAVRRALANIDIGQTQAPLICGTNKVLDGIHEPIASETNSKL